MGHPDILRPIPDREAYGGGAAVDGASRGPPGGWRATHPCGPAVRTSVARSGCAGVRRQGTGPRCWRPTSASSPSRSSATAPGLEPQAAEPGPTIEKRSANNRTKTQKMVFLFPSPLPSFLPNERWFMPPAPPTAPDPDAPDPSSSGSGSGSAGSGSGSAGAGQRPVPADGDDGAPEPS